jgi:hypothetical protein
MTKRAMAGRVKVAHLRPERVYPAAIRPDSADGTVMAVISGLVIDPIDSFIH